MKRLYDLHETAEYMGRTPGAVREMKYAGKLPVVKIDKRDYFDVRDLDRIIEESKVVPAEGHR